jgi:hypothetical protein
MAATLNQPTLGGKDQPTLLLTANGLCGATKSAADDTPLPVRSCPAGSNFHKYSCQAIVHD